MNREELEIWTRFACAVSAGPNCTSPERFADSMLDQWRKRRDAVEAAEAKAEAERERRNQEYFAECERNGTIPF